MQASEISPRNEYQYANTNAESGVEPIIQNVWSQKHSAEKSEGTSSVANDGESHFTFAYERPSMLAVQQPSGTRIATTASFVHIAPKVDGRRLSYSGSVSENAASSPSNSPESSGVAATHVYGGENSTPIKVGFEFNGVYIYRYLFKACISCCIQLPIPKCPFLLPNLIMLRNPRGIEGQRESMRTQFGNRNKFSRNCCARFLLKNDCRVSRLYIYMRALFDAVYKRQTFNGDVHSRRVHVVVLCCCILVENSGSYLKYHGILDLVQKLYTFEKAASRQSIVLNGRVTPLPLERCCVLYVHGLNRVVPSKYSLAI